MQQHKQLTVIKIIRHKLKRQTLMHKLPKVMQEMLLCKVTMHKMQNFKKGNSIYLISMLEIWLAVQAVQELQATEPLLKVLTIWQEI